jgi:hypothetical protein
MKKYQTSSKEMSPSRKFRTAIRVEGEQKRDASTSSFKLRGNTSTTLKKLKVSVSVPTIFRYIMTNLGLFVRWGLSLGKTDAVKNCTSVSKVDFVF